ncbi:LuxR family transcriptional regulator AbsR2 [Streptomyces poriticola]|uniref:LuxR family transcriptional regulator AbsR2 n=1 Tax=Streptomyces poriticola TaxID=3120506 RepID=UPI002FCE1C3F
MTTFDVADTDRDTTTLRLLPWPFTARRDELELVRRAVAAGRPGLVVTGQPGHGKTRLVTEAVRGTDHALATGTPATRHIPFAAFAHLLPERVTLHRAVRLLSAVRLLLVDDAHLLDADSAALVHQLAVHGRTRLLVVATDGAPAPAAVARLWTGELLPRLALEPLPRDETAELLAAGTGRAPDPLTADRLHRLCGGDLRLLRDLTGAVRERGLLATVPDTGRWTWRGPVPMTPAVRERTAHVLDRPRTGERGTLERLAFAEPLPLPLADADAGTLGDLETLEREGLVHLDGPGDAARLAHPLHGPVLRSAAGRLRARRLSGTAGRCGSALTAERAALVRRIERADLRETAAPVGEWLVDEGAPVPAGYAAVRARCARLRGELRTAAAWAREGLRQAPGDPECSTELALAAAQSGEPPAGPGGGGGRTAVWSAAARGDLDAALSALPDGPAHDACSAYDAVRLGFPRTAARRLTGVFADHAGALARGDGPGLDRAAEELRRRGFLLFAAEAHAQAARVHRDPSAARTSRTRAMALAAYCQGARTPALSGLVLGELTARQRQVVTLAAAGLSNRQIAERLTLSVRTVGNHLYSAYARLGAGDRGALPWLVEPPEARSA